MIPMPSQVIPYPSYPGGPIRCLKTVVHWRKDLRARHFAPSSHDLKLAAVMRGPGQGARPMHRREAKRKLHPERADAI